MITLAETASATTDSKTTSTMRKVVRVMQIKEKRLEREKYPVTLLVSIAMIKKEFNTTSVREILLGVYFNFPVLS